MKKLITAVLALLIGVCMHGIFEAADAQSRTASAGPAALDAKMLASFKARGIGPAVMSGRVSCIALDPEDIFTFYIGLGTGGVMKTTSNGATFTGIFEKEAVAAIGAIAVAPSNAKHVWVGTGEANDRNSSSWGNGVYRSTDGGSSWMNVGLGNSRTIARILLHPSDTNTVFVAAMGDLWSPSPERGLYKTSDGGKTWRQLLGGSGKNQEKVGCGDVVMDPANPNVIIAALYARKRTPWSLEYGAGFTGDDVGGIYKSIDGGSTWKKLTQGLPGLTGRIGLTMSAKSPRVVYAVVQSDEGGTSSIDEVRSKKGGVFRSDDGGETWTRMSPVNPRPFYFSQIRVDPANDAKVYLLGYMMHVSEDSGKTWREDFFKNVHSDCHDLIIDPRNPKRLLLGTDGGAYQSYNGGAAWEYMNRFAGGEYYRIAVDMSTPYRIAGGLQDNLNWLGPSMTRSKEGILNSDWVNIGGGDGFYCVFDSQDSTIVFAESQGGEVHRYNLRTGEFKGLRPEQSEGQPAFRFHWNSPLIGSTHTPGVLFLAGNRIFKLTARGEQWTMISPDLSAHDPDKILAVGSGAENYAVVYTLAESPLRQGLLWAGTDDGKLWVTRDEGAHWIDLTGNLPKAARGQWISRVEPGHHDPDVAYLAVSAFRSGNYAPLLYKTTDSGDSWESIAGDLPVDGPVKVVREGLNNPYLLFVGTEFGLHITLDGGSHWTKFDNLPTVAVDDIVLHPRDFDLVIATHGRSLYIVDDIRPLEDFTPDVQKSALTLFQPPPAAGFYLQDGWVESSGGAVYRGANRPAGAILNYFLRDFTGEPVTVAITNASGKPVANLTGSGTPGFNRLIWDLQMTGDLLTPYGGEGKKFCRSGEYTVTVSSGKDKSTRKLQVNIDAGIETR